MKRIIVASFIFQFIFISISYSQVTKEWEVRYSGPIHTMYEARSIALDAAGNIYVTGISRDTNFVEDYATIKYNSKGVQQWVQIYNGPGKDDDEVNCVAVDASGNVYVSGSSKGDNTNWDYATIKYNTDGVQQWVQRYNGTANGEDKVTSMGIDNLGNVYVTGSSYGSVPYLPVSGIMGTSFTTIKYNSNGLQQWVRKFNELNTINPGRDFAKALAVDNAGNIYVTGQSVGKAGPLDFNVECVTIKYNTYGDSLWTRKYQVDANIFRNISPSAITVNSNGYVFVTGVCTYSLASGNDYFTIKYNSYGDLAWAGIYSGPGSGDDQPYSIVADLNDVYITGMSMGSTGYDYSTIKYNFSGVQQWAQRYNGPGNGNDVPRSIKMDASGYIYVTGASVRDNSSVMDIATIKYDSFGNQKWLTRYNGLEMESNAGYAMALNSSGEVFVAGAHADTVRGTFQTIKYKQTVTDVDETHSEIAENYLLSQNYPNPFNPNTTIVFSIPVTGYFSLKVYNVIGQEMATVLNGELNAGIHTVSFNGSILSAGIYLYKLSGNNISISRKMILLK